LFFFSDCVSPCCAPGMLATSLSKASLAVISFLPPLLWRYLFSLLQGRQRVRRTSSPLMETMGWSGVRFPREQWSATSSPRRIQVLFCPTIKQSRTRGADFCRSLEPGKIRFAPLHEGRHGFPGFAGLQQGGKLLELAGHGLLDGVCLSGLQQHLGSTQRGRRF